MVRAWCACGISPAILGALPVPLALDNALCNPGRTFGGCAAADGQARYLDYSQCRCCSRCVRRSVRGKWLGRWATLGATATAMAVPRPVAFWVLGNTQASAVGSPTSQVAECASLSVQADRAEVAAILQVLAFASVRSWPIAA